MAAKMEEIYPPKLNEFAYVTDGACTDADLLDMEKILLLVIYSLNTIMYCVMVVNLCLFSSICVSV